MADMAAVLDHRSRLSEEVLDKLHADILADTHYAEMFAEARRARRDAGLSELWEAMSYLADLEELLSTEGWEDPAEVLMPGEEDTSALGHRVLIALVDARIARGEDGERLLAVKERLERHEVRSGEELLDRLVWEVGRLSPGSAERMIARAGAAMEEVLGA